MAMISGLTEVCAGSPGSNVVIRLAHPKQPYQIQNYSRCTPSNYCGIQLIYRRIPRAKSCLATRFCVRYVAPALRSHHGLSHDDEDFVEEPFWLTLKKEAFGALKSLFFFLLEQPSQLKYIEWPSFQSTVITVIKKQKLLMRTCPHEKMWKSQLHSLKTASLTLVLMALLIVALASVDSALCYLLALFLRKSP